MTKLGDTKWDKQESTKKPLGDGDKQTMVEYYEAGLKTGKRSEDLLAELEERYDRSDRQILRYIAKVRTKNLLDNRPYEETPHKQKMREIAGRVMGSIRLPSTFDSFCVKAELGRYGLGSDLLPVSVSKDGKIEVELHTEWQQEPAHLYEGLCSHLETWGFPRVIEHDIGHLERGIAANLMMCHSLLELVRKELEETYAVSIPADYQERPGFTIFFPITLCWGAVEQASGAPCITDSRYECEGLDLRFGGYLIYRGLPNEDLEPYRNAHKVLRQKYAVWEQTKKIATYRKFLSKVSARIRQRLQKFMDMERVPGWCELCS